MDSLIFDSFALLRFFQRKPGSDKIRKLLEDGRTNNAPMMINAINVGEIICIVKRRFGEKKKLEIYLHIQQVGLTILPCPNDLNYRAAELKATYPISYADAFVLASAIEHSATLVTGDPEFKTVEHLVKIVWI